MPDDATALWRFIDHMRDFKSMKRQRSRNRGGGGGGGGGKPTHNANRAFDSNGPDGVKIRGNAQHVFEKYQQLARDAASSGDRVLAENYLQHAEHYFRVLRAVQPQRPASEIIGRDAFTSGIDIDFEDESGGEAVEAEAAEGASEEMNGEARDQRPDQPRGENGRQEYRGDYRQDRQDRRPDYRRDEYRGDRDNRQEGGRRDDRPRDERPRDERPRDERPRDDRGEGRQDRYEGRRDDRGYRDGRRDDRDRGYRDDRRGDRYEGRDRYADRPAESAGADPLPVVEPEALPLTRPRQEEAPSPTLRSQDGGFSPAPAFLQSRVEAAPEEAAEPAPEPRRRRRSPRQAEETAPADES